METNIVKKDKTKWIWFGVLMGVLTIPFAAIALANALYSVDPLSQWEISHEQLGKAYLQASLTYDNTKKAYCESEKTGAALKLYLINKGDLKIDDKKTDDLAKKSTQDCFTVAK